MNVDARSSAVEASAISAELSFGTAEYLAKPLRGTPPFDTATAKA